MVYAVIMAGGSGTRFWPKSTRKLPKQFLSLFGEGTMIQNTAKRIEPLIPQDRIMVVTNDSYVNIVQDQLPGIPAENIVGEPVAKNTAPCVAIAAELLVRKDPEAVMVVLPADHHIEDPDAFISYLETAIQKAKEGDHLVTIGIHPDRPETGYGYIHGDVNNAEKTDTHEIQSVKAFKEKPNLSTAKKFLDSGDYYWNSGMFVWTAQTILKEFQDHLPDMYGLVKKCGKELYSDQHTEVINDFYHASESVSIDYGIMEHAKKVFVIPGEFGWNDVGSWTAVYDLGTKDDNGNVVQSSHHTLVDSKDNLVFSESNKMISLVGLEGFAVVETQDAILICKLDEAQKVKEVVERLKGNEERKKFL